MRRWLLTDRKLFHHQTENGRCTGLFTPWLYFAFQANIHDCSSSSALMTIFKVFFHMKGFYRTSNPDGFYGLQALLPLKLAPASFLYVLADLASDGPECLSPCWGPCAIKQQCKRPDFDENAFIDSQVFPLPSCLVYQITCCINATGKTAKQTLIAWVQSGATEQPEVKRSADFFVFALQRESAKQDNAFPPARGLCGAVNLHAHRCFKLSIVGYVLKALRKNRWSLGMLINFSQCGDKRLKFVELRFISSVVRWVALRQWFPNWG